MQNLLGLISKVITSSARIKFHACQTELRIQHVMFDLINEQSLQEKPSVLGLQARRITSISLSHVSFTN